MNLRSAFLRMGSRCAVLGLGIFATMTVTASSARADSVSATLRADPNPIFEGQPTSFILDLDVNPSKATFKKGATFGLFRERGGLFDTQPTTVYKTLGTDSVGSASLAFGPFVYAQDGVYGARVAGGGTATKVAGKLIKSFNYDIDVRTSVTVNNVAPSLDISSLTWAPYITLGDTFAFRAAASDPGAFDTLTYEWDFNFDGSFNGQQNGSSVNYGYSSLGSYLGAVRVFDGKSYSQLTTFRVQVDPALRPDVPDAPGALIVPAPLAVWGGALLLGAVGVGRTLRRRMGAAE